VSDAATTQEYLLVQLKNMNVKAPDVRVAIEILENHFQDLRPVI